MKISVRNNCSDNRYDNYGAIGPKLRKSGSQNVIFEKSNTQKLCEFKCTSEEGDAVAEISLKMTLMKKLEELM